MLLNEALSIAERIREQLAPHCAPTRCLIAGSIRRRKPEVKDIEIVCQPRTITHSYGLFSEPKQVRDPLFSIMLRRLGTIEKGDPETGRYVQLMLPEGIKLDCFIPRADDYYRQLAMRTGPADYSGKVLAHGWVKNGWCGCTAGGLRLQSQCYKSGELWHAAIAYELMTKPPAWQSEQEFYDWLGVPYLEPEQRTWPL